MELFHKQTMQQPIPDMVIPCVWGRKLTIHQLRPNMPNPCIRFYTETIINIQLRPSMPMKRYDTILHYEIKNKNECITIIVNNLEFHLMSISFLYKSFRYLKKNKDFRTTSIYPQYLWYGSSRQLNTGEPLKEESFYI